ncbi:hypothetical protein VCHENC02_0430B, partial [Vibrio harveyi]
QVEGSCRLNLRPSLRLPLSQERYRIAQFSYARSLGSYDQSGKQEYLVGYR